MIWTPENKILLPRIRRYREKSFRLRARIGIGGFYRAEAMNMEDGRTRWLTPWFHNHITNVGLDMCATTFNRYNSCQVGTGTAAPTDADTSLQTFHAGTSTKVQISATGNASVAPYWYEDYKRYDFATGAVVGNMTEVGIGPSSTTGTDLFSRELIRDSGGSPTAISVSGTEALRVHHRLRHYAPEFDATGTIVADFNGVPTDVEYTRRAHAAGSFGWNPRRVANGGGAGSLFGNFTTGGPTAYTGALVAATASSTPSGTLDGVGTPSTAPYSPGSYARSAVHVFGTGAVNGNIRTMLFSLSAYNGSGGFGGTGGKFQVEFDPVIPKTNLDNLTVDTLIAWGRFVP